MSNDFAIARINVRRLYALNDPRLRSPILQILLFSIVVGCVYFTIFNLNHNRAIHGIATGYGFLNREAGFAIAETPIPYTPRDTYARAFLVGLVNTLKVSAIGILLATFLGIVLGVSRLSSNWLVAKLAGGYIDLIRNVPLVIQLLLWGGLIRIGAPPPRQAIGPLFGIFISNRGIQVPAIKSDPVFLAVLIASLVALLLGSGVAIWARKRQAATGQPFQSGRIRLALFIGLPLLIWLAGGAPVAIDLPQLQGFNFKGGWTLSPEFTTMLVGLTVYTSSYIAEIVRGGLLAVSHGQTEAARALGLHTGVILRRIVLPQALNIVIPPLTSQYLNLIKNSSLAVVIGFPDLVSIGNTIGNQTGQVVEAISIFMAVYLFISLAISLAMNAYNRRIALQER